jgi:hypothetical protein
MARDICKTAAFAFRMCIEEMQRTEQENPFQVQGELGIACAMPRRR